jgi:hypothetical protein
MIRSELYWNILNVTILSPGILYGHGGLYSMGAGPGIMIISAKLVSNSYNWVVIPHDYYVLYEPSLKGSQISWQFLKTFI